MHANRNNVVWKWRIGLSILICLVVVIGVGLAPDGLTGITLLEACAHAQEQPRSTQRQALPRPDHIVIVIEENKGFYDVFTRECPPSSGKPCAPYLMSLAAQGTLFDRFFALHHPSLPNYIELFSGSNHGIIGDCCPLEKCQPQDTCLTACTATVSKPVLAGPSLAGVLLAKDKSLSAGSKPLTFAGYAEDLPKDKLACCSTKPGTYYARKHCPWLDFIDVPETNPDGTPTTRKFDRGFWAHRADIQRFSALPTISFLIPNLINDMHSLRNFAAHNKMQENRHSLKRNEILGREVHQGDVWLKTYLADYVGYAMKPENNSLLIITWDEDSAADGCKHPCPTFPPANRIPTIVVGAKVKSGYKSVVQYTHYNLLRTILDMYDLPHIGGSQQAEPITDIWK
jgi:phosphatidylinositol-3-phosphatase